jgi:hypothetical protein
MSGIKGVVVTTLNGDPRALRNVCDACGLAPTKILRCGKCKTVYCDKKCYSSVYKAHLRVCKTTIEWHALMRTPESIALFAAYARTMGMLGDMEAKKLATYEKWFPSTYITYWDAPTARFVVLKNGKPRWSEHDNGRKTLYLAEQALGATGCVRVRSLPVFLAHLFTTGSALEPHKWPGTDLVSLVDVYQTSVAAAIDFTIPRKLGAALMVSPRDHSEWNTLPCGNIDIPSHMEQDLKTCQRVVYMFMISPHPSSGTPISSVCEIVSSSSSPSSRSSFSSSQTTSSAFVEEHKLQSTQTPESDDRLGVRKTGSCNTTSKSSCNTTSKDSDDGDVKSVETKSTTVPKVVVDEISQSDAAFVEAIRECREQWRDVTSVPERKQVHYMAVVLHGGMGFSIQSYYGLYSTYEWLQFDVDLVPAPVLPPAVDGRYHAAREILKRPEHRGVLSGADVLKLAQDYQLLASDSEVELQRDRFAKLTGVRMSLALIDRLYTLTCTRCLF